MQPYFNFDMHTNPLIVMMDRHGTCMVNLQTSEVFNIQSFEDQAFYINNTEARSCKHNLDKNIPKNGPKSVNGA